MHIQASDFGYSVSPRDILIGHILDVDLDNMTMRVELAQFPSRIALVPVRPVYVSMYTNSGIFVVPRRGDKVLLQFNQGEYIHLGYYNPLTREESGKMRTRWTLMREAEGIDAGLKVPPLSEGDVGIFVRGDGNESVDLVLSTAGLFMLSAGATSILVDGKDFSFRSLLETHEVLNSLGFGVRYGTPVVGGGEYLKQFLIGDFSYEMLGSNEELRIGFIPKDKLTGPLPELSEGGAPVRLKLKFKASQTELIVDLEGNLWIKSPMGNALIKLSELKLDTNYVEVDALKGAVNVDNLNVKSDEISASVDVLNMTSDSMVVSIGDLVLTLGNVTGSIDELSLVSKAVSASVDKLSLTSDIVSVLSDRILLGTGVLDYLVKKALLPLLEHHTHRCADGSETLPSSLLSGISQNSNVVTSSLMGG